MDKDGAAAARDARPGVVVDLNDEIVEIVFARESVGTRIGRHFDRLIVVTIGRIFAPAIGLRYSFHRQRSGRTRMLVGPPP